MATLLFIPKALNIPDLSSTGRQVLQIEAFKLLHACASVLSKPISRKKSALHISKCLQCCLFIDHACFEHIHERFDCCLFFAIR